MGNALSVIAIVFTMFATLSIAYYAQKSREYAEESHKLNTTIQKRDEKFRQETLHLYKAMVISNLLYPDSSPESSKGERMIRLFNKLFTQELEGETLLGALDYDNVLKATK